MLHVSGMADDDLYAPRLTLAGRGSKEVCAQFASPSESATAKPSDFCGLFPAMDVVVVNVDLKPSIGTGKSRLAKKTMPVELVVIVGFIPKQPGVARRLFFTGMPIHMPPEGKSLERMVVLPPTFEGNELGGRQRWCFQFPVPDSLFDPTVSEEDRFRDFEKLLQEHDGGFRANLEWMTQDIANACKHGDRFGVDVAVRGGKEYFSFVPDGFDFGDLVRDEVKPPAGSMCGDEKRVSDHHASLLALFLPQGNIAGLMSVYLDSMMPASVRGAFNFDAATSLLAGNLIMTTYAKASADRRFPLLAEDDARVNISQAEPPAKKLILFPGMDESVDASDPESIFTHHPAEKTTRLGEMKIVPNAGGMLWSHPSPEFDAALVQNATVAHAKAWIDMARGGTSGSVLSPGALRLGERIAQNWKRRMNGEDEEEEEGGFAKRRKTGNASYIKPLTDGTVDTGLE